MMPLTLALGLELERGVHRAHQGLELVVADLDEVVAGGDLRCFWPALSVMVVCTTSPMAFSRTRATNFFTTSKATSASSRETRMSRSDSSTSSGVISLLPGEAVLGGAEALGDGLEHGGNRL